jgi:hypothetical protein
MVFLNSIALWGGLAALGVAVPILIHLFNRLRHRNIDWAAMEFLRRAMVVRSRRIKMEDVLLMALRGLALLLLGLALARPTLRGSQAAWLGGRQVAAVVALDASFSMACGANFTRFDRARQRAQEIFATLQPGQSLTLVLMGQRPRILLRNVGYEKERCEKALADEARVLPERLRLEANLDELETLTRELRAAVRECYIITDGQAQSWRELSEKSRQSLTTLGGLARVFVISAAPDTGENLAVTRLELAGGGLRKGAVATFEAEVRNFGQRPVQGLTLRLKSNDKVVDQRIVERLEPGQAQPAPLYLRCEEAGTARLSAEIGPDALLLDNARYAVAQVQDELRIVCVDGRIQAQPFRSSTDYLLTALQPKRSGPWASLSLRRISPRELAAEPLEDCDVLVLANVAELPTDVAQKLRSFVEKGGGLFIFAGEQVQAPLFNRWAGQDGAGLAPAELLELAAPASEKAEGWAVETVASGHLLSMKLGRLSRRIIEVPRVRSYLKARLLPGASELLRVAGTDSPLLSVRPLGRGQVLLLATSADTLWTDLPLHPLYFILLHEGVSSLARKAHEQSITVAAPMDVPLPAAAEPGRTVLRDGEGHEWELAPREVAGIRRVQHAGLEQPGFYEIAWPGGATPLVLAANLDAVESDVRALLGTAWAAPFRGLQTMVLDNESDLAEAIRSSRVGFELWGYLVGLALAVLVFESYLARRFSKVVSLAAEPWLSERGGQVRVVTGSLVE